VPLQKLPERAGQLKRDKPYAVICESGSRSCSATDFLLGQGFEGAVSVKGGTSAWARTKPTSREGVIAMADQRRLDWDERHKAGF